MRTAAGDLLAGAIALYGSEDGFLAKLMRQVPPRRVIHHTFTLHSRPSSGVPILCIRRACGTSSFATSARSSSAACPSTTGRRRFDPRRAMHACVLRLALPSTLLLARSHRWRHWHRLAVRARRAGLCLQAQLLRRTTQPVTPSRIWRNSHPLLRNLIPHCRSQVWLLINECRQHRP